MKKKLSIRVICLVVAGMMLSGVLMVSAINGSPYEVLKSAVFDALFYDDFTINGEGIIRIDGEVMEQATIHESVNSNARFYQQYIYEVDATGIASTFMNMNYETHGLRVRTSRNHETTDITDGRIVYRAETYGPNNFFLQPTLASATTMGFSELENIQRDSNAMRLFELGIDMLVGDMRNHLSMTSQSDGTQRISGTIAGHQIPELLRLLIDIQIESNYTGWGRTFVVQEHHTVLDIPLRSMDINRVSIEAVVDSAGNLTYFWFRFEADIVNMLGHTHAVDLEMGIYISEVGTSNPQSPIPNLTDVFMRDFMYENFGRRNMSVFFSLDENGYIDVDSIRDTRAGR
ncbi:MAG: hypothetical protein FWC89_00080 [Defluviitaleaceae bacterium]|nr:hypothetical protein [Defluviitaleaceae bacterium]